MEGMVPTFLVVDDVGPVEAMRGAEGAGDGFGSLLTTEPASREHQLDVTDDSPHCSLKIRGF